MKAGGPRPWTSRDLMSSVEKSSRSLTCQFLISFSALNGTAQFGNIFLKVCLTSEVPDKVHLGMQTFTALLKAFKCCSVSNCKPKWIS